MKKWMLLLLLVACADSKEARLQKFLLKGNVALKERNYEQASYYYGEALKVDACYADAWNNLGYFLVNSSGDALCEYLGFFHHSPLGLRRGYRLCEIQANSV